MNFKKHLMICICLLFMVFSFSILSKDLTISGEDLSSNNIENEIAKNEEVEKLKIEYEELEARRREEDIVEANRVQGVSYLRSEERRVGKECS